MADVTLKLTQSDFTIVKYQIDREKIRFLSVAKRCRFANPLVITQDPFLTRGILFPTIYHLACPRLVKLISHLEASPFFKDLKRAISSGGETADKYRELMGVYRQNLTDHINFLYKNDGTGPLIKNYDLMIEPPSDSENFSDNYSEAENKTAIARELFDGLISCGLAGSREIMAVKCLHALYGFLIGAGIECGEVLYFRTLIEDRINSERGEEFKDIFKE